MPASTELLCWQHREHTSGIECAICMECVGVHKRYALACSHVFHRKCIKRWLSKGTYTCPLCRADVETYAMYMLNVRQCKAEHRFNIELAAVLAVIDALFLDDAQN